MKCFYHKEDYDGKCSGAIVRFFEPDITLIPFNYDMEFPWDQIQDKKEVVYMVDISLPDKDMYKLNEMCNLIYIDHHKSKIESLDISKFKGSFDTKEAACIQTWNYLTDIVSVPYAVRLIGKYDVWEIDETVLNFQFGLSNYHTDPNNSLFWDELFISEPNSQKIINILEAGKIVRRAKKTEYTELIKNFSFKTKFRNFSVLALNILKGGSLIFETHPDYKNVDILMTFSWTGEIWKFSLYTTKDNVDVSAICKEFGGGGHKQASGFSVKKLPPEIEKMIF